MAEKMIDRAILENLKDRELSITERSRDLNKEIQRLIPEGTKLWFMNGTMTSPKEGTVAWACAWNGYCEIGVVCSNGSRHKIGLDQIRLG